MLKLLHLNIERDKHIERFVPFVLDYKPDVVTMQEVMEPTVPLLKERLGLPHAVFSPMYIHPAEGNPRVMGVLIASPWPLENAHEVVYYGPGNGREFVEPEKQMEPGARTRFAVQVATVRHPQHAYPVATTHFPWTPDGEANDIHRAGCATMIEKLKAEYPELIFSGDFNAPRGKETFTKIAAAYHDNVPAHYMNSLDKSLHRAGNKLPDYMVDGLFTTPGYVATDVKLHAGVSDHMAITATIKPA